MRSVSGGDDIGKINYYAEGLQAQVKTNIGMARGESKTLNVIRSEHKSNISELTELNPNTIAKLDATSQERIAKNSSLILIQQFTLPNARYHLVGREDERKQLQEKVQSGTITALLGMAGSGKSALAKKFAREWDEERSGDTHRAAIWLSADTEDNLRRNFDILLQKLKVEPRPQDKGNKIPTKEKAQRIWEKLGQIPNLDWLVVFDNVPEAIDDKEGPAVLHDWFFPCTLGRGGRILLTSRSASYSGNTVIGEIAAINVDVLKTDDAVKLLLRDAPNNKNVDDESSAAKELVVDYLDHLPLAIVTVAAQIVDTKPAATVSGYLKEIKQKRADGGMNSVLEVLRGTLTYARNKGMGYELDIAANVNPDKISVKLFRDTDSARRLCKLNLLQLVEDGMYSMHRLLQKAARQDSSPEKAIDAVWSALASYNTNVSVTWTVGTEMLPHIQFLRTIFLEETDLSTLQEQTVITYGYCLGTGGDIYSASLGDFSSGRAAYEMALKVFHQAYGEGANNLDIANLLNSLGLSCMAFSRYEDARKHLEDSLRMKRSGYGAGIENNDIIRMLANLGSLHLQVGEYDKALTVLEESRDMHYSLHGKHVTSGAILRTLCLLGNLNMQLSQRTKAQKIFGDCLEMSRDIHGELHENILVAGALNALGVIHHFNRKFEDALECFEKSLDIKLHVYSGGANNADIAGTLNDLGLFYKARGNYEKAEMTLDKALIMTRHIFGKKAPNALIAKILGNLGNLYRTIGKYEKAHTMQKDALAMKRAIYDVNHDDIAMTLNNLGNLQRELGNHKEALPILKEALAMYHHCYGKDFESADIARTLDNLGLSHMALENYEEARTMLEKSLKMKRACTGGYYEMDAKTPSIAIGLHSLGCLYTVTGKHKEASTKLQESLAMMHAVYGEEVKNVEIANVLDSLGDLDKACGNYRGAQTMFEKSLAMYCHVYYQYTQHPKIDDKVKKLEELEELCALHHSHWFFHL
jgi:tetratricopeptide (TPR) repeat protein